MIRSLTVFLFFLLLSTGCQFSGKQEAVQTPAYVYQVDVVSTIENKSEMLISDIASEISYIPLETTANNLIRNIRKVVFTENFIFVSDVDGLYQFTTSGQYIQRVGSQGRGPGEYLSILNFGVNEKANTVLVVGEYSTITYDLEGNFIQTFKKPPGIQFEFIGQDRIVFYKSNNINRPINLIITSLDLLPIREFINYSPKPATNYGLTRAPLYNFNDHIYFKEHWNDTIFCIKDSVRVPHIIINEKDLLLDKGFELKSSGSVAGLESQLEKVEDKLMTPNILESDRFVFVSYRQGMNPRDPKSVAFLFDKEHSNTICIKDGLIKNDIDGGPDFYPHTITNSGSLVQWVDAFNLKAHIKSDKFTTFKPENVGVKSKLEALAGSLKENDNPVLMIMRL